VRTESYKCDGPGCTHVKGESNHWFVAVKILGSLTIKPWAGIAAGMLHLCGESCVQKVVSEFLSNQPRRNGESVPARLSTDDLRPIPRCLVAEGSDGSGLQEAETLTSSES
jgi:hypothetical protein